MERFGSSQEQFEFSFCVAQVIEYNVHEGVALRVVIRFLIRADRFIYFFKGLM